MNLFPAQNVVAKTLASDSMIFADAMVSPWVGEGWSYGTEFNLASDMAHSGTKGISVTHTEANGAFKVYSPTPLSGSEYASISFWAYGAPGGSPIQLFLGDDGTALFQFTAPAGVWTQYNVPLSELGSPATFDRMNWQDSTAAPQPTYYLDDITVIATTAPTVGFPDATADGSRRRDPTPGPSGVAVAPSGRVYMVVYKEDRVYSWETVAKMLAGDAPDLTIGSDNGDPDSEAGCPNGPSATMMCGPESIAVDSNGNLFVADTYRHRVLVFFNPETDPSPVRADSVLGQLDLSLSGADNDSNNADGVMEGFCFVRGLAVDANNRLWVVDEFNYRVVRFDTPLAFASLPNKVFGQADLDDNPAGCEEGPSGNSGANQFSLPLGVAVDSQGAVYVTDHSNNRVQRFAADAASGAAAEASYTSLNGPHDVAVDKTGNVYIADTQNNQVLVYKDGADGDLTPDHTFPGRNFPMGMAFTAAGDFLLADCGSPLPDSDYPPCLNGDRGVYFFAAPEPQQFLPPNAVNDTKSTLKNTPVSGNVLTNDSDPQDDLLAHVSSTQPSQGTVTFTSSGDYTFTPATDFVGQVSFTYTIINEHALSATATVTITVTEEGEEPVPETKLFMPSLASD